MTPSPHPTLGTLASALQAELRPPSAAATPIQSVASPALATPETLVFAEDQRAFSACTQSSAAAILTTPHLAAHLSPGTQPGPSFDAPSGVTPTKPLLLVPHPKLAFARAALLLQPAPAPTDIHPQAHIAATAQLAPGVSIGPFAVLGEHVVLGANTRIGAGAVLGAGCILGPDCHIHPRVVLYSGVQMGARVIVHAGAVLGSDGFGYVRDPETGAYLQFPQQGTLVLEDDVEIGANTTIDRGALAETRLAHGVKLDNLVHIGHNVQVGAHVVIAAQTGISGSSTIAAGAILAGQVGIADHVHIGENVILGAQSGVPSNKRLAGPGILFWGTPARPITQYLKELATLARLTRNRAGR